MRAVIFLHSTTGNTRLVAHYAAARLENLGIACHIYDLRCWKEPSLDEVDLLGVAFPVMYARPTVAIERAIERLSPPRPGLPAFILATAAGSPHPALYIMGQQLIRKGLVPIGAHWVMAPSNLPAQLWWNRLAEGVPLMGPLYRAGQPLLSPLYRPSVALRALAALAWREGGETDEGDRDMLDRSMDQVAGQALANRAGARLWPAFLPGRALAPFVPLSLLEAGPLSHMRLSCHQGLCDRCGACVLACPLGCVSLTDQGVAFESPCGGCWACYNACPKGAISGIFSPRGRGRYLGPTEAMGRLLSPSPIGARP